MELMSTDPSAALCVALRPFMPAFQRSLTEISKSGRETLWSTYDTQSKAAAAFALDIKWAKVRKAIWTWLKRQAQLMRKTDWRRAPGDVVRQARQVFGSLRALVTREGKVDKEKLDALLAEVRGECDAVKPLFQAGAFASAGERYTAALEKLKGSGITARQSVEMQSELTKVLVNVAICAKKQEKFKEAIAFATEALDADPKHVKALFIRGTTHFAAGDPESAVQDLARAVALDPTGDNVRAELKKAREARNLKSPDMEGEVSRSELLAILAVTARLQNIIQEKVSSLAHDLVEERRAGGNKSLPFVEGHMRIHRIELPLDDPLADHGLTEQTFQEKLMEYEKDAEVMGAMALAMRPPPRGNIERARQITGEQIVEIHQLMVTEMRKILDELRHLPSQLKTSMTRKSIEVTAELLVSMAVEREMGIRSEDVEQALMNHESFLCTNADFLKCSEDLAVMMQELGEALG
eukprot:TRINITY_DN43633_c0_g1_i1.p1 TRINITY_DN43633_c0_g1~~TRINITY_DN43633_c0_g1_i1.p1  ORF type:complete len:528 (-),score=100.55 TRINITY_DN43633_c0_g1_i1:20-1420(-)